MCVCVIDRLLTKCRSNRYTDFDAVFAKQLLTAVAQPLLKLVNLGQRSRSQGRNIHFSFIIIFVNFPTLDFSPPMSGQNEIQCVA